MPKRTSLDVADEWPKHIANALGANRDWMQNAKCRAVQGRMARRPWTADVNDVVTVGPWTYTGEKLIEYALLVCRNCPAQWDCATFCMKTWQNWGTWSVDIAGLRWLHDQADHMDIIDKAREEAVPVQVVVNGRRSEERRAARRLREERKRERRELAVAV